MKNAKKSTTLIIGAIVIAVTLFIFFVMTKERIFMHWTALFFALLAEVFLFGGILWVESAAQRSSGTFLRSGTYGLLSIYAAVAIILAILFPSFLTEKWELFVVIEVILIAATIIILLLLVKSGQKIGRKDSKVLQAVAAMESMIAKVNLMKLNPQNIRYKALLTKLYEALYYSDVSMTASSDHDISDQIDKLEEMLSVAKVDTGEEGSLTAAQSGTVEEEIGKIIEEILLAIQKRSEEIKQRKRGGV